MRSKVASSRSFGLLITVMLAAIAGFLHWQASGSSTLWAAFAAFFLLVSIAIPRLLLPLKRLWLKLGELLRIVVSPVILIVLYAVSIVFTGMLVRIFRKDLLSLKLNPRAPSYWIKRDPAALRPESLKNQF